MNALIIGYGSIGRRHCRILSGLGCKVSIVSQQEAIDFPVYQTITHAFQKQSYDLVIISNRTYHHYDSLYTLRELGYKGTVLVEKPLFDKTANLQHKPFQVHERNVFAAYNLRFHPILQQLKRLLEHESVISVQVYVGQYLPDWRIGDYRERYSAKTIEGGGVLRDLSHELDYIQWLFGTWKQVAALGGQHSELEIDSEDVFAILLATNQCPVISIQMNYLDRIHQRQILINTNHHTFLADLVHHTLQIDKDLTSYECHADTTYLAQNQALLQGQHEYLCSFEEALETVRLIEQTEQSAASGRWIIKGGS